MLLTDCYLFLTSNANEGQQYYQYKRIAPSFLKYSTTFVIRRCQTRNYTFVNIPLRV